jgi:hypothetical protein
MDNPRLVESELGYNSDNISQIKSDITLRDIFAGLAMHAFHVNPEDYWGTSDESMKSSAEAAYKQADAMLKAREGA